MTKSCCGNWPSGWWANDCVECGGEGAPELNAKLLRYSSDTPLGKELIDDVDGDGDAGGDGRAIRRGEGGVAGCAGTSMVCS